jgi:hypothetical protein
MPHLREKLFTSTIHATMLLQADGHSAIFAKATFWPIVMVTCVGVMGPSIL